MLRTTATISSETQPTPTAVALPVGQNPLSVSVSYQSHNAVHGERTWSGVVARGHCAVGPVGSGRTISRGLGPDCCRSFCNYKH